ncbi:MAG: hypothetical protein ACRC5C_11490 [Bacilli bacterium]
MTQYDADDPRRPREHMPLNEPRAGRFKVINRIEIPKGEFTYDNAVRKLQELDEIYKPFAIYCDRGAGEYQIEMLRKTLGKKVKGVHLGSSYEVRDPVSRTIDKKPLKPFIVNQTVLMMERGQLRIPNREYDEMLFRQMTNYQVIKHSSKTGEPTYSNTDEHALDAFMFCLLAFINELPDIASTIEVVTGAKNVSVIKQERKDPFKEQVEKEKKKRDSNRIKKSGFYSPRRTSQDNGFSWGSRGSTNRMPTRSGW